MFCGDRDMTPCRITVNGAGAFTTLQAAVNAAPNGTVGFPTVIHVTGKCVGPPTLLRDRSHIVIEGDDINSKDPSVPRGQCRAFGPRPDDLLSTVASNHGSFPSGSNGEVIKILGGTNSTARSSAS
jgi:hypothetical protein